MRVVLDTNVLVSYLLFPNRAHATAVRRLIEDHTSLYSEELIAELLCVLGKRSSPATTIRATWPSLYCGIGISPNPSW
jgi:predicted nucleic acid-binding protein